MARRLALSGHKEFGLFGTFFKLFLREPAHWVAAGSGDYGKLSGTNFLRCDEATGQGEIGIPIGDKIPNSTNGVCGVGRASGGCGCNGACEFGDLFGMAAHVRVI